ncbi:hypothetical protein SAMN02745166_00408 [Prosthecobacter debontii]|uniref:Uncharacterized protein n=1 Tax=Prosthecobacter debontii TaxID=48467 RepID=A0A1T4WL45_9BACT|nr:hypothetical protein SAMN02745166_00408 [Prosthecobacter debontii]
MDRRPALNTSELCIHSPSGVRLVLQPLFIGGSLPSFKHALAYNNAILTHILAKRRQFIWPCGQLPKSCQVAVLSYGNLATFLVGLFVLADCREG